MPHFFIKSSQVNENKISICDSENYRHIARALRARVGEKLLLIDENQIQYEIKILNITNNEILCEIENSYLSKRDLEFDLYLAQSLDMSFLVHMLQVVWIPSYIQSSINLNILV